MVQLRTILRHVPSWAGPTVMLLYSLYASVCAIESPSKLDDEQWLAYWIIYSFMTLMEMVAQPVLAWIPIWYPVKMAFAAWLVLPQFRGASFLYERFVREQMERYRRVKRRREKAARVEDIAGESRKKTTFVDTYVTPAKGEELLQAS